MTGFEEVDMPVSSVQVQPDALSAPPPSTRAEPPTGFASALSGASARLDPTIRPTVSLGEMIAAIAAGPSTIAGPLGGVAGSPGITAPPGPGAVGALPGTATAGSANGSRILAAGERYLGVPYRWGGTSPTSGFDCSGFVQRVFADLGVKLPRVSVDQAKAGTEVASLADARPGDLVFWYADGKRPNHIGIYAGDNRMLVAPRTGDVVRYQELSRTPHEIRRVA
jgi:peptidoglycan DL-endopeptidase CwlO